VAEPAGPAQCGRRGHVARPPSGRGGTRGIFAGPDGVADLDRALASIPAQMARGFTTICVKPSQFIDSTAQIGAFCGDLVERVAAFGGS
jgi:hypothetical protein